MKENPPHISRIDSESVERSFKWEATGKKYSWVGKIHCKRARLLIPVFLVFPSDSASKESACNEKDLVQSLDQVGNIPTEGNSYPLQ